ncbi:zinc transporter ZIP5 [Aplochiton taeniatus]
MKLNKTQQQDFTSLHLKEAFEEQGYYLHRLFQQYGDNGTLSYGGLQNLLGSLGLGDVLEINHHNQRYRTLTADRSLTTSQEDPLDSSSHSLSPSTDTVSDHFDGDKSGQEEETLRFPPFPLSAAGQELLESLVSNHPTQRHLHGNCLNVTQLLWNFGLGKASHITPAHFTLLCPALLYQIDSGVCVRHRGASDAQTDGTTFLKALGWSSVALLLISVPSLLALSLVPLLPPAHLQTILCPMSAMAVGTLCGDALLHLLPHAMPGSHSEKHDFVLKGLCVMGGLYLLFIIESLLGLKSHGKKATRDDPQRELSALQSPDLPETALASENHGHHHGHSHGPPHQEQAGIGSLVWMVVMGDGIHNLTDGLAIGAAFSQSLAGGLSTTVAVFCHELPHELGDLAVLLGAGWRVRRLVIFSAASAMLGFVGLLAGSILGHHSAELSPWILTVTAGVFLYVALVDLMPEMLHRDPGPMSPLTRFMLQNLGLLAGGAIMLCISLFEDQIAFNLGDG